MHPPRRFFVYIVTNRPRSHVLYTGVTGNLVRRTFEHKNKVAPGFTSRYNLTRLVYYEMFVHPAGAIAREKEIKGWRRSKKVRLIEGMNPQWQDLAAEWGNEFKPSGETRQASIMNPDGGSAARGIPHPAEAGVRDDASKA